MTPDHTYKGYDIFIEHDEDTGPPWKEYDGHGDIREVWSRGGLVQAQVKKPGEVVLHRDGSYFWLYDVQSSTATAKKDEWGIGFEATELLMRKLKKDKLTPGEITAAAVQADIDYLRGYIRQEWWYVGVVIKKDGEVIDSCWGFQDDDKEGHAEFYKGVIDYEVKQAEKEAAEKAYWESRDVCTV